MILGICLRGPICSAGARSVIMAIVGVMVAGSERGVMGEFMQASIVWLFLLGLGFLGGPLRCQLLLSDKASERLGLLVSLLVYN